MYYILDEYYVQSLLEGILRMNMDRYMKISVVMLTAVTLYFAVWPGSSYGVNAQPGTQNDPLVSRSYVDGRIAELEAQIAQLTGGSGTVASAMERELFHVVRAEPGTTLVGGASTEIILRAGEATVVAGPNGLANITAGMDIMNGQAVQTNHLLIVPQADGRGMHFHTVAYLMVKGDYHFIHG